MRKKRFILNVFIISLSMLCIRIATMAANIYISARAGASAMGIYHMIFSVFIFGITFASSGTGFAATRLIAEKRASDESIVKKCLSVSALMSAIGFLAFFFGAPLIQKHFINAGGVVPAIRILSFALPCMAASSVYRGYFIAKRNAALITSGAVIEEGVCIGVTVFCLKKFSESGQAYMSLVYGCAISNFAAFLFDSVACRLCLKRNISSTKKIKLGAILSICVPIGIGSYLRTALIAVENLMIPLQFARFGTENPVAEYGIIKAMAMSVVIFPTVFIQAFSQMLVPEISELNASNLKNGIIHVSTLAVNAVMMFSVFISLMLFCHHEIISRCFF